MKHYSEWFGLGPYDDCEGYRYHWYNKHYEWGGERYRLLVGDLSAIATEETGGIVGPTFEISVELSQEDMGELDEHEAGRLTAKHDVHYFGIVFWRWGINLSVRGRVSRSLT